LGSKIAHYKIFIIQISNAVHTQSFIVPSSLFLCGCEGCICDVLHTAMENLCANCRAGC